MGFSTPKRGAINLPHAPCQEKGEWTLEAWVCSVILGDGMLSV